MAGLFEGACTYRPEHHTLLLLSGRLNARLNKIGNAAHIGTGRITRRSDS